jgi:glycosyltransferase involved in cell wall biosynthesis
MTAQSLPISIYLITKDNIRTVENALKSVAGWADEIVAVDSGSTDGTVEILKKYTDRVTHHDWPGVRDQYQHAQDLTKNRWVMFNDADEDFGSQSTVLFQKNATSFLDMECIAMAGGILASWLINRA